MPEFNSITDPTPSFTISSRIISVSPKRIETGSCTSMRTARLVLSSMSVLFGDMSIHRLLSSRPHVTGNGECLASRIHLRFRMQLVFPADFNDDGPFFPLIQH